MQMAGLRERVKKRPLSHARLRRADDVAAQLSRLGLLKSVHGGVKNRAGESDPLLRFLDGPLGGANRAVRIAHVRGLLVVRQLARPSKLR
jgi:hypothetical protein